MADLCTYSCLNIAADLVGKVCTSSFRGEAHMKVTLKAIALCVHNHSGDDDLFDSLHAFTGVDHVLWLMTRF